MRKLLLAAGALAALTMGGCGKEEPPPAEQAAEALASARDDVQKAQAALQAVEERANALQERIASQRAEFNDIIQRKLALLQQQLKDDEERLRRLPAQRETELRPRLDALAKRLEEVGARLHAYRDAPPEKAPETLAALEKSLADFAEARRDLESALQG
jgi:peptidoglycan hydrolase CwlO-like protein